MLSRFYVPTIELNRWIWLYITFQKGRDYLQVQRLVQRACKTYLHHAYLDFLQAVSPDVCGCLHVATLDRPDSQLLMC